MRSYDASTARGLTTATSTLTGKTCTTTRNGTTKAGFFGAWSTGGHALLTEDGTTVKGAAFSDGTKHPGFHVGLSFRLGFHH